MTTQAMPEADISEAPLRKVDFWEPRIVEDRRPDGTVYVRQADPLPEPARCLTDRLVHFAEIDPDRPYLGAREPDGEVRRLTYGQTLEAVRRLGTALLRFNLSPDRPLLILSANDIEHALLGLASQYIGVPYAPISPAYSLVSKDYEKVISIAGKITPGLVFAADGAPFANAIAAAIPEDVPVVVIANPPTGRETHLFSDLAATEVSEAVEEANRAVTPDTIAKFLFTSGSTGSPKGVVNTQRMLCSNQEMVRDCFRFMQTEPPVVLDWAPWNHTAGGNKVFNMVLYNGGSFFIDDGRPTPDKIGRTARNIKEVSPTWYFNVPRGYEDLVPLLEADSELRRAFYKRLNMMMYAGAGLAQHTWDALERLAVETTGERVVLATGMGSTETAPFALMCTTDQRVAGNLGLPSRGIDMKLVPTDGKMELRVRGPNVMPGYWREPELTAEVFDDEGFYNMGDALRFADPDDASQGFYFDGRTAENFKLNTGTWVGVGALRAKLVDHFGDVVRDAVITGLNRDYLGALVFPDMARCRAMAAAGDGASDSDVVADPTVHDHFAGLLTSFAATATGSATRVTRLILMTEPPSIDRGEVTDKGSINQRAVREHRSEAVDELYEGSDRVIVAGSKA